MIIFVLGIIPKHIYTLTTNINLGGNMLSMRHKVICQYWGISCLDTKFSTIPGVKTLHIDLQSKNQMLNQIKVSNEQAKQNNSGIILKPVGNPKEILVDENTYKQIQENHIGLKITLSTHNKKRTD